MVLTLSMRLSVKKEFAKFIGILIDFISDLKLPLSPEQEQRIRIIKLIFRKEVNLMFLEVRILKIASFLIKVISK